MAKDNEPIYISVLLEEYIELSELRDFFEILREFDIEDWEGFDDAVAAFLEDDPSREDPRDM